MPAPASSPRPVSPFAALVSKLDVDPDLQDWATSLDVASLRDGWERCSIVGCVDIAQAMGVSASDIAWALYRACDAAAGSLAGPLRELMCLGIDDYAEIDGERAARLAASDASTPQDRLVRAAMGVIAYGDACYHGARLNADGFASALEAAGLAEAILLEKGVDAADLFRLGFFIPYAEARGLKSGWDRIAAANPTLVAEVSAVRRAA